MDPAIDWRAPEGVPIDHDLWADPTWRDADAETTMTLRAEVVRILSGNRRQTPSAAGGSPGPGLGTAILGLSALALALGGRKPKRRRP